MSTAFLTFLALLFHQKSTAKFHVGNLIVYNSYYFLTCTKSVFSLGKKSRLKNFALILGKWDGDLASISLWRVVQDSLFHNLDWFWQLLVSNVLQFPLLQYNKPRIAEIPNYCGILTYALLHLHNLNVHFSC